MRHRPNILTMPAPSPRSGHRSYKRRRSCSWQRRSLRRHALPTAPIRRHLGPMPAIADAALQILPVLHELAAATTALVAHLPRLPAGLQITLDARPIALGVMRLVGLLPAITIAK